MAKPTVTFHSRYTQHDLTRQPVRHRPLSDGDTWVTTHQPVRYKFTPTKSPDGDWLIGELTVTVGQDKLVDHMRWLRPGEEEGIERDAPDALRAHYNFGSDFWEAPVPSAVFRKNLGRAAVKLDEEAILGMIAEEQRTAKRRDLLDEAQTALATVREERESLAAAQAEAEAQTAEDAPAPKAKAKPKAPAVA